MPLWKISDARAFLVNVFINVWTKYQLSFFDTGFFNPVEVESVYNVAFLSAS